MLHNNNIQNKKNKIIFIMLIISFIGIIVAIYKLPLYGEITYNIHITEATDLRTEKLVAVDKYVEFTLKTTRYRNIFKADSGIIELNINGVKYYDYIPFQNLNKNYICNSHFTNKKRIDINEYGFYEYELLYPRINIFYGKFDPYNLTSNYNYNVLRVDIIEEEIIYIYTEIIDIKNFFNY